MKDYPHHLIRVEADQLGEAFTFKRPTLEACKNFESYLEPEELEKYNKLSERSKLIIALSTNPFIAFRNYKED